MTDIIIHHYPQSPVSEKVRTGLGLKGLAWRSVEENRLPDRPDLLVMTGGYRRIPVMQIGSDIFCDTQCILQELERRHPTPSFFPDGRSGTARALSRWTDGPLFSLAVRVAFAPEVDQLPEALVADRARLYLGPEGDFRHEREDLPHTLAQLRAQFGWLDHDLGMGKPYLLGDIPGMQDLVVWTVVWFVRNRYVEAERFMTEFPNLAAWAGRMGALGHGQSSPMTPVEALAVARSTEPQTMEMADGRDAQGLKPGMRVTVAPDVGGGDPEVEGEVLLVAPDRIALRREAPECGAVVVHFPRVGYRVRVA